MKSIQFNKQSLRVGGAALSRFVREMPYVVLIQRFMAVRLLLLIGLLLVALWAIIALLYVSPATTLDAGGERPLVLQTGVIDELEVWLEEREDEHRQTIMRGSRDYFAR